MECPARRGAQEGSDSRFRAYRALGFRGLGFRISGLGLKAGLGCRTYGGLGLGFRV